MININSPLFCLTSDVDWASDYAIQEFLQFSTGLGITPTVFATHSTSALDHRAELGIHPNFLPGSSHGTDTRSVIDFMLSAFPQAKAFRSHHFVDSSDIAAEMFRRGIKYDSNLCLHMQDGIVPLRTSAGPIRFPVFWEDDVHWSTNPRDWSVEKYVDRFTTPGLKIINVHPFFFAANIPDQAYYEKVRGNVKSLSAENAREVRYSGEGVRTFVEALLKELRGRGHRFYTLHQLFEMTLGQVKADQERSSITVYTEDEYQKYWKEFNDDQRQSFVQASYNKLKNAADLYATSPDTNLRDLEVDAIREHLPAAGTLHDLGCGNGFTLYALGEKLSGWKMIGVDFSEVLIRGAERMKSTYEGKLQSVPQFILGDAIAHLRGLADQSVECVVTERFLQNLPSRESQYAVIREAKRVLRPGGRLLMCEGSQDGFDALNDLREGAGLPRIPASGPENVSALRFRDAEVERVAENDSGLKRVAKVGFSTYFMVARVLHPLLVSPQKPRYDARINELARRIQMHLPKDSTLGSNILWVYEKTMG